MCARRDPGLVGGARSVRTRGDEVPPHFNNPSPTRGLLGQNVAENTAFLLMVVVETCPQFVKHAARDEGRGCQFGIGMLELPARGRTVILENADVAETSITFQILNSLGGEQKKLLGFALSGGPQLPVVLRILNQDLVRAHVRHAVVNALTATIKCAFNVIN